ncbi:MAG: helix-turn-helix transcriptional regulator [Rhodospirillales bacterium]
MDPHLIDQIYECAFLPEQWPALLDRLARLADARGGQIFVARPNVGPILRWSASPAFQDDMAAYVEGRWARCDRRRELIAAGRHAGFVTEHDIFPEGGLETDAAYTGFYRPRGLGWCAFTSVTLPTTDWFVVSVERNFTRGPVEPEIVQQLDAVRPHIARSALLSARLNLERARAISETLALIGLPSLVFDQRGKVLAANQLIEALTEHVRWRTRDRVCLTDRAADGLFQDAIAAIDIETTASVRSFAVRDGAATATLVAHIIPVRGSAPGSVCPLRRRARSDTGRRPASAPRRAGTVVIRPDACRSPLARSLAAGDTLGEIATVGSVSRNTVRTHLRGVLEKTGCRRQAEVVALLSGLTV